MNIDEILEKITSSIRASKFLIDSEEVIGLIWIAAFSIIVYYFFKLVISRTIGKIIAKGKVEWAKKLLSTKLLHRVSLLVAIYSIIFALDIYLKPNDPVFIFIDRLILMFSVIIITLIFTGILRNCHTLPHNPDRRQAIKTYTDAGQILVYIIAIVFVISIYSGKSPWHLLSLLGGLTAIVILIFKDTILGILASIQMSSIGLLKIGDWIEMDDFGANGDVIDMSIYSVKVQNFDKTITTIPTPYFVSKSFKNWRGMVESGGRRIKRHLNIDMESIKFCDQKLYSKFSKTELLKKRLDTIQFNEFDLEKATPLNAKMPTNLQLFRMYTEEYLRARNDIHLNMTFLVRHLQSTTKGLPVEIYIFSNRQEWAVYEEIQAEIIEHLISVLPEFDLLIYQDPAANVFKAYKN
ncbi:MAG: mechanosensitive ion channel family protein [Desulfotalea sp.]